MSSEIKITAQTVEGFTKIKEMLNNLPVQTLNRIEVAESGIGGVTCTMKYVFKNDDTLYFPNNVKSILPQNDGIRIICEDFTFFLGEKFKDCNITYRFI